MSEVSEYLYIVIYHLSVIVIIIIICHLSSSLSIFIVCDLKDLCFFVRHFPV